MKKAHALLVFIFSLFIFHNSFAQSKPPTALSKAKKYLDAAQYDSSLIVLNVYINLHPNDVDAHYFRGVTNYYLLKADEAIFDFDKTILLLNNTYKSYNYPGKEINDAYLIRGQAYAYLKKDYESAFKDINKSLLLNPANANGYFVSGTLKYSELKDTLHAIEDVSKAITIDSTNLMYWFCRGSLYFEMESFSESIIDLEKTSSLNNGTLDNYALTELYFKLGTAYSSRGNINQALNIFNKSLTLNPDDAATWYNKAMCYYKLENYPEACNYFHKACQLDDNDGCNSYEQLNCLKYKPGRNSNCDELTIDDLIEIMKSDSYREQAILKKGFNYSYSETQNDIIYNSNEKWKRKFYSKCNNTTDFSDFYCNNKIFIAWNLDDNSINYSTNNYEIFQKMFNEIVNVSTCEKQQLDISIDDLNRVSDSKSHTSFMEVYCCQNYCFGFMKNTKKCGTSNDVLNFYTVAVRPK